MDIKTYDKGWNDAMDRAIEIVNNSKNYPISETIHQLKNEFRNNALMGGPAGEDSYSSFESSTPAGKKMKGGHNGKVKRNC